MIVKGKLKDWRGESKNRSDSSNSTVVVVKSK